MSIQTLVGNAAVPEPPYPSDVRARGWTFQLDMERVKQSITWLLAPSHLRPWLLMLWAEAWTCAPCGSLEANDEVITARIGMDPDYFRENRDRLMRGWVECTDGRLYHHVLTELVEQMRNSRKKERDKKAAQRAGKGDPGPKPTKPDVLTCPQTEVMALYNEILGATLPAARTWGPEREKACRSRWREVAKDKAAKGDPWKSQADGIAWFRLFFEEASKDDFIMGRSKRGSGHETWEASIDYLLSPKGFKRVFEGHGRRAS